MLFEIMGASANLWNAFDRDSLGELFESIPEFFSTVNSCLPQNRFVRLVIYGSSCAGLMQFAPYILRHTEFFDYFYRHIVYFHRYCPLIEKQKIELFKEMSEHIDDLPKYDDKLMIVEVQCGGGSNLTYYPNTSHLIAVDDDVKYEEQMMMNFDEDSEEEFLENVNLERFICSHPEQLIGVPDETISAIVCVHSMCYPLDLMKCLDEFKRVLMPGGRLYFIEHTKDKGPWLTWDSWRQIKFVFVFALMRCHLRRCPEDFIYKAGFSQVHLKDFILDTKGLTTVPLQALGSHIYGYAIK